MAFVEQDFPPAPTNVRFKDGIIHWFMPCIRERGPEIFLYDDGSRSFVIDKNRYEISFTDESEESVTLNIKKK